MNPSEGQKPSEFSSGRVCAKCRRIYRVAWWTRPDLWQLLSEEWQDSELCLECYFELLEASGYGAWNDISPEAVGHQKMFMFGTEDFHLWLNGQRIHGKLAEPSWVASQGPCEHLAAIATTDRKAVDGAAAL